jgi:hypothetical protein
MIQASLLLVKNLCGSLIGMQVRGLGEIRGGWPCGRERAKRHLVYNQTR